MKTSLGFTEGMIVGMAKPRGATKFMDWQKVQQIVNKNPDSVIYAGLMEDWEYTSCLIYAKGSYYKGGVFLVVHTGRHQSLMLTVKKLNVGRMKKHRKCTIFPNGGETVSRCMTKKNFLQERKITMNKWIGMGNLTRDPEIRQTDTTTIAKFGLAVARKYKRDGEPEADFLNCTAFGKTAEFIEKYFKKGSKIAIVGRIQTGSYTNKEGQKVYTTDIMVEEVEFAERKSAETTQEAPQTDTDGFMNIPDGLADELPFN